MAFLDKTGLQTLTNKLVQGDAIKVASHRGKNVKEVIDNIQRECENVALPNTMTLENRVSEFKVGQGRDVDVSGNVEDSKIGIELQGKTYQNLVCNVKNITSSQSCDVKILDLNNLSFVMTYKNDITGNTSNNRALILSDFKKMLKPSTIYTFIYKYTLLENPKGQDCQLGIAIDMWGQSLANSKICRNVGFSDINITKATSLDLERLNTMASGINFINQRGQNTKWRIDGLIILEGDHTQTPIEELPKYLEGIKSSFEDGIVEVEVQGKNLFDGQLRTFNTNDTYIDNIGQHHNGDNNIPIKPNTSYTMTFETISGDSNIYIWNGNEKVLTIPSGKDTVSFRTPLECNSLSFYRSVADYTKDRLKYKIQLEENSKSTSYEPYYKKKISFNIGEPLKSLPNGICDEIRNNNGQWELVRRVGNKIFNGNETYTYSGDHVSFGNYVVFHTALPSGSSNVGYCDRFPSTVKATDQSGTHLYEAMFINTNYSVIYFKINKTKLESIDNTGVKKWFSQNPTTVYYELAEPIITPIDPIEFDISQGTTVNINSNIPPASTHKVILNRAGQIEQGIELIADLRNRVNALESIYDSNLIATQYKLDNLKLNYELEREED